MRFGFVSEPMVEQQKPEPPPRRPRRKWLRRVGWTVAGLLAVLVIFHRPIVFEGTRYFVVRAAKQQNLDIDYEIGGSIFSTLTISNLRAAPTEPGPIQRLEIGNIDLRYSLWGAVRRGLPALLDLVQVRDVFVEITPAEEPPPEKREEPQQFKFPALFPKTLQLENINFVSHGVEGVLVVEGLWFTLLPDQPGVLEVATLDIPGVRKWTEISGRTTFRERHLVLTEFRIGPEIALEQFDLDASRLEEARLGVGLEGTFFDAPVSVDVAIRDLNKTNELSAAARIEGLEFARIGEYLNLELPLSGTLTLAAASFSGRPEEPETWNGAIGLRLGAIAANGMTIGDVLLGTTFGDGSASADVALPVGLAVHVDSELPAKLQGFRDASMQGTLAIFLPDVSALDVGLPETLAGDLAGTIRFGLADGEFGAEGAIRSRKIAAEGVGVAGVKLQIEATKNLRTEQDAPAFEGATAGVTLSIADAQFREFEVDAIEVAVALVNEKVALRHLSVMRGANALRASGETTLPVDMASFEKQPWKAEVTVKAPALHEFLADGAATELRGTLGGDGTAASEDGKIRGDFEIAGRNLAFQGVEVPTIDGRVTVDEGVAKFMNFALVFDDENTIRASGEAQLAEPYSYRGTLNVNLGNLSIFDPVAPEPVAGSLVAEWEGSGTAEAHTGRGSIELTNGQYGALTALNAGIEADYSPDAVDVPVLRASAEMGGLEAKVHWEDNALSITGLTARLKELPVLSGSVTVPFVLAHWDDIDRLVPDDGAVNANLETPDLPLVNLFAQLGDDPPPASGTVSAKLSASGTVRDLVADFAIRATNIEAAAAEGVQPANANLDLALRDNRLVVTGRITEPRIKPLAIEGAIPVNVSQVKRDGALPPDTPLDLRVSMPDSPLGFVAALVPAVRFIEGVAGIDLKVSGTMEKPRLAGSASADIRHLRLNNEGLPPITNVVARLDATTERVTVSQFRGEVGGGVFGAEGTVDFGSAGEPVFDLAFGTRNALVMQDEAITLRISSRLALKGPLDSATVSGDVFVTRSRFYKDIDILPIGLPGRPAPQPPEAPPAPGIVDPPLRDWKFDIAIRTADPFLVQGNLANGRVLVDLHVGGTGMNPWADGSVRIEQLRTSLPFSTLEVDNGLVYFTKDHPFLPQFDIRGTSQIRDYAITAYIYGDLTNPQATFTSNPPLPQTEIVSLIATGVTSRELAGNPSVLAGKAAMLLFQKISRTLFHRGSSEPPRDTLLSRIDFELGATDPKTGHQGIGVRFPLTDNIVLSSGVDVGGDFRGQVKYLIRFR